VSVTRGKGFTLIELLIVLIIMSIALGIVGPFMANSFDSYRLRESSRGLLVYLMRTREAAIEEGARAIVYFDDEEVAFQTVFRRHGERLPLEFPEWFELAEGVRAEVEVNDPLEGLVDELPHFVFFPMGNAVGGIVRLSVSGKTTLVEIDDVTGTVSVGERAASR
jgi:general secretion pathway protein H